MDEMIEIMRELLDEMKLINMKLDNIQGCGVNSIDDVCDKLYDINSNLESIRGDGTDDTISDICDKLEEIKGVGVYNSLADVCDKLDEVTSEISNLSIQLL